MCWSYTSENTANLTFLLPCTTQPLPCTSLLRISLSIPCTSFVLYLIPILCPSIISLCPLSLPYCPSAPPSSTLCTLAQSLCFLLFRYRPFCYSTSVLCPSVLCPVVSVHLSPIVIFPLTQSLFHSLLCGGLSTESVLIPSTFFHTSLSVPGLCLSFPLVLMYLSLCSCPFLLSSRPSGSTSCTCVSVVSSTFCSLCPLQGSQRDVVSLG
jgi:hypothetical protein